MGKIIYRTQTTGNGNCNDNVPAMLLKFCREFLTIVLNKIFVWICDWKSQWFGCYRPKYLKKVRTWKN